MKRLILCSLFLILGLLLVLMNQRAASWYDRCFHWEEVELSRASTLLKEGKTEDYETALKNLVMADKGSEKIRAVALFNLGCSSLDKAESGDSAALKNARFYFKEALRNDPSLFSAKYNLELVMRKAGAQEDGSGGRLSYGEAGDKSMKKKIVKFPMTASPRLGDKP